MGASIQLSSARALLCASTLNTTEVLLLLMKCFLESCLFINLRVIGISVIFLSIAAISICLCSKWSVDEFFDSLNAFSPIQKKNELSSYYKDQVTKAKEIMQPFILRRLKAEVWFPFSYLSSLTLSFFVIVLLFIS